MVGCLPGLCCLPTHHQRVASRVSKMRHLQKDDDVWTVSVIPKEVKNMSLVARPPGTIHFLFSLPGCATIAWVNFIRKRIGLSMVWHSAPGSHKSHNCTSSDFFRWWSKSTECSTMLNPMRSLGLKPSYWDDRTECGTMLPLTPPARVIPGF